MPSSDSNPPLEIRRYRPGDAEAVWDLHNRALYAAGSHPGSGQWDEDVRHIQREYLNPGGEFLVGLLDGALVAMGGYQPAPDRQNVALVRRMRVDPSCQRHGFGRAIYSELERRARQVGIELFRLDTTTRQRPAQKFYESQGFQPVGTDRFGRFDLIIYEKRL
ncbi:MAG: GNAT family N-acetyltransferase [Phycisphaerae bacterium]